jgi:hypothetical protein
MSPEEKQLISEYIKANNEGRFKDSHKIFLKIKELNKEGS